MNLAKLRTATLAVAVAIGDNRADTAVREAAQALNLEGFAGVHFDKEIAAAIPWSPKLKSWLSEVGRDLIAGDRFGRPFDNLETSQKEVCEQHAFGYGGFGGVTITSFNVPTSTVTALWLPGEYAGRPWIPLFLRRGRLERAILV